MNGKMAYVVMCVEKYLSITYPNRDWRPLSRILWQSTSMNWGDWPELYSCYIPDLIFQYQDYDPADFADSMDENTFYLIKALYSGITCGREDDPEDTVNILLNLPHKMAMLYEGTTIGDGQESLYIIDRMEKILIDHGIQLPDYTKVLFSKSSERNGWGNNFDGSFLSIIL